MTYTKMTPEDFVKKLSGDGYKSATAARRAVGKAAFNQKGKDKSYAAIDAHFGDEAKPTKTKAPKRKTTPDKPPAGRTPFDTSEAALKEIELADRRVGTITQALAALKAAKEADSSIDTKAGASAANAVLTDIMKGVHESVRTAASQDNGISKKTPATTPAPETTTAAG